MENTGNTSKLRQGVEESSLRKVYCKMYLLCCKHASPLFCYRTDYPLIQCRIDHWEYMCMISEFEVLMYEAAYGSMV